MELARGRALSCHLLRPFLTLFRGIKFHFAEQYLVFPVVLLVNDCGLQYLHAAVFTESLGVEIEII